MLQNSEMYLIWQRILHTKEDGSWSEVCEAGWEWESSRDSLQERKMEGAVGPPCAEHAWLWKRVLLSCDTAGVTFWDTGRDAQVVFCPWLSQSPWELIFSRSPFPPHLRSPFQNRIGESKVLTRPERKYKTKQVSLFLFIQVQVETRKRAKRAHDTRIL